LLAVTIGGSNVCVGVNAGDSITSANSCIFIGSSAGGALTVTGGGNAYDGQIGIGTSALAALTSGAGNLAIGYQALDACNTGVSNIAVGSGALGALTDAVANVGMGLGALGTNVSGNYNTAFGHQALQTFNADVDGQNTAVGINAGQAITTGDNNTIVGAFAGDALQGGADNTIIGANADASAVGGINQTVIGHNATGLQDNSVVLGNTSVTAWLPPDDNGVDLGSASYRFSDVFAVQTTVGGIFEANLKTKSIGDNLTGTIVSWKEDKLIPCNKSEDELVMGVIKNGKDEPIVLGAEPVLVTGKVKVGDYIVTSDKLGHGKSVKRGYLLKKDLFGKVIAQALEKSDDSESCLIKCMIRKM